MDYKIELFRPFLYRDKGRIKQVAPGTYSVPDDMPDAAGQLAVSQGVAKVSNVYTNVIVDKGVRTVEPSPVEWIKRAADGGLEVGFKRKRKYTRKKPAPSNKLRSVPENKSALATS